MFTKYKLSTLNNVNSITNHTIHLEIQKESREYILYPGLLFFKNLNKQFFLQTINALDIITPDSLSVSYEWIPNK